MQFYCDYSNLKLFKHFVKVINNINKIIKTENIEQLSDTKQMVATNEQNSGQGQIQGNI